MGLIIKNLTGGYGGRNILRDVTLTAPSGGITAIIGLNGAGKSTLIQHIIGQLAPQQGGICTDDADLLAAPTAFKQQLAYVPEQPILYDDLTLDEHIVLTASAYQLPLATFQARCAPWLERFRLTGKGHWWPGHFSKGMQQKVLLVLALALERPLLVLDEPFIGLDAVAVQDLIRALQDHAAAGQTVIMTTHLLETAADFVDHFVLLGEGQVRFAGSPAALAERFDLAAGSWDALFTRAGVR